LIWRTRRIRVLGLLAALLLAILLLRWAPTQAAWDGMQHIAHGVAWRFADRRSSPPLATGDGWRAYADHICDETRCDIQSSPASVFPGQVVFIKIDVAEWYLSSVAPRIAAPHIVVSHNGDNPFTRRLADLLDRTPQVAAWFAQNIELDTWHPRLLSIPIGLEDRPYVLGSCPALYARLPTYANLLRPPSAAAGASGGVSDSVGQPAPGGPFALGWALAGVLDAGSAAARPAGRQSRQLPEASGGDANTEGAAENRALAATAQPAAGGSPTWRAAASAPVRPSTKLVYAAFNVATNYAERQRAAAALAQLPSVSYHVGGATVPADAPALLVEAAAAADAAAALDGALEALLLRLAEWRLDVVDPPSPLDARSAAGAAAAELRAAVAATAPAAGAEAARRASISSSVTATRSVVTEALKGCQASAGQIDQSSRNFAAIAGHPFVASPPGNGLQAHRTWEALIGGSIPIVLRSGGVPGRPLPHHAMDQLYAGLPVLLVGDWSELSQELLLGALLRLGHVMSNTLLLRQCASLLGQPKREPHPDGAAGSAPSGPSPHLRPTGKSGSGGNLPVGDDSGHRRAALLASCLHRGYVIHAPDASPAEPAAAAAAAHSATGMLLVPQPDFDPMLLATPPERLKAGQQQQLSRAVFRFERIYGAHWLSVIDAARWEATALGAGWYAAEASA
jgi:hypothetical protein